LDFFNRSLSGGQNLNCHADMIRTAVAHGGHPSSRKVDILEKRASASSDQLQLRRGRAETPL
jgi:hypothetical protein